MKAKRVYRTSAFVLIVLMQLVLFVYFGFQKQGYHIDEIYSYILSNSYDADKIGTADWMWNQWITPQNFDEFITVQPGEGFSYPTVYMNNSTDSHPPLFYWCLHTICSFFPDQFSKWFGIALNLLCYMITALFLFLISRELFGNSVLSFIPLVLWGCSGLAVDTVLYIRMYMMLTMFTVIFTYIHVRLFKYGINWKRLIAVTAVVFLGTFTQYYFAVFAFFCMLFFCVYLIKKKEIKWMFCYGAGGVFSILMVVVTYPYVIQQATGSDTNNVGNMVAGNFFSLALWPTMIYRLLISLVMSISVHRYIVFAVAFVLAILILCCLWRLVQKGFSVRKKIEHFAVVVWLTLSVLCTVLAIAHIGGEYVYLRYIFFICPQVYLLGVILVKYLFDNLEIPVKYAALLMLIFAVGNAALLVRVNGCSYLYSNQAELNTALKNQYSEKSCIVITEGGSAVPTGNLTLLENFPEIYMGNLESVLENNVLQESFEMSKESVVFINTDTYWMNGYAAEDVLEQLLHSGYYSSYEKIGDGCLCEIYLIR